LKIKVIKTQRKRRNQKKSIFFSEPIVSLHSGSEYTIALSKQGHAFIFGTLIKFHPISIIPNFTFQKIITGEFHVFAFSNSKVFHWGLNTYGQLGIRPDLDNTNKKLDHNFLEPIEFEAIPYNEIKKISCGSNHTVILKTNGDIIAFGNNSHFQYGSPKDQKDLSTELYIMTQVNIETNSPIVDVFASSATSFFLTKNGKLFGCGWNAYGQLGIPDLESRQSPTEIPSPKRNIPFKTIGCSDNFTFFVLNNHNVFSSGWNRNGACGYRKEKKRFFTYFRN